ncbi:hypothetical protein PRZ48_008995 [Zasmidium cellare]|uniref:Uncharacterized protein n=1 Tax=Zasmidium cellare TaxID=395010 RepID=A0ABR0EI44_ZASCE|nr:hypothetical protein PRZ48_008995 [Zasmidium cellare]
MIIESSQLHPAHATPIFLLVTNTLAGISTPFKLNKRSPMGGFERRLIDPMELDACFERPLQLNHLDEKLPVLRKVWGTSFEVRT